MCWIWKTRQRRKALDAARKQARAGKASGSFPAVCIRSAAAALRGKPEYLLQKEQHRKAVLFLLEQGTGIEPASTAWEAVVLPMY